MVDLQLKFPDSFFDEEIRSGYTVTRAQKELWAVELDLLNEFDRVCREYGLKYFADGGTTLGAVRHKGFIPWDDDIDLVMFRLDYNRLCEIAEKAFHEPYFFQTEITDRGSMRGHAQLRNSNTTGILMAELDMKLSFNQGIYIDVYPLDNVPEDERERRAFIKRALKKRKLADIYARLSTRYRKNQLSLIEFMIRACHMLLGRSRNPFYCRYESFIQSWHGPTQKTGILCLKTIPDNFILERAWYSETVMMPFEMLEIPVCAGYEAYLSRLYGDWQVPRQNSNMHGGLFFDADRSYSDYICS